MYEEPFTDSQDLILRVLVAVSASLSIIGCLFIIISYVRFKECTVFHLRLIFNLAVTDCVRCELLLPLSAGWIRSRLSNSRIARPC